MVFQYCGLKRHIQNKKEKIGFLADEYLGIEREREGLGSDKEMAVGGGLSGFGCSQLILSLAEVCTEILENELSGYWLLYIDIYFNNYIKINLQIYLIPFYIKSGNIKC